MLSISFLLVDVKEFDVGVVPNGRVVVPVMGEQDEQLIKYIQK